MTESLTSGRAGLFTREQAQVPLAGVAISAEISAFCARVTVTQRYVNRETTPIEAVYLFPLDEGAAVSGFEAIVDGTLVVGEVLPREDAFRIYDEAMERGDGAFLLDEERPDVFVASVGNLAPGKEVLLKLTYVTELAGDGTALRFAIPTTVAPRYAPLEDQRGVGRPDAETLNAPTAWQVPYGLDLSIRLAMAGRITRVESPSHPIAVTTEGTVATVSLSGREAALDRDFVLAVGAEGLDVPQAWLERGEDRDAIAIGFVPTLATGAPVASEVIFLVDRSGSMAGTSMAEVRNALQLCLRSLTPGCHFNIVGFGSSFEALFEGSEAYDDVTLERASGYVAALDADLGGTEILPALEHVLSRPRREGLPRQLVVLTDGEVTNTDAVFALARRHRAEARIFTFGIGAGASHHLVRGLARAGGGAAELIHPGERIEPKVLRQFARLLSPALTDVTIDWGGLRLTQAPSAIPPVFTGSRLLVYAFVEGRVQTAARVQLAGRGLDWARQEILVDPAGAVAGSVVSTLAARARIRELEEGPDWTAARGSRQSGRKAAAVTQEIVALATQFGLMSRETSYVAVERREAPVEGEVQLRRVPIALTAGWGGLDQQRGARFLAWSAPAAFPASGAGGGHMSGRFRLKGALPKREMPLARWPADGAPRASLDSWNIGADPMALIRLQRADGSWDLTDAFAVVVGCPLAELEAALPEVSGKAADAPCTWATALALAWLYEQATDSADEWRMIAAKGNRWLDASMARPAEGEWLDLAASFLRGRTARTI